MNLKYRFDPFHICVQETKHLFYQCSIPEAKFKEFETRLKFKQWLKFKPWFKYGWFHLKLYSIFQDLSRRSIETGF